MPFMRITADTRAHVERFGVANLSESVKGVLAESIVDELEWCAEMRDLFLDPRTFSYPPIIDKLTAEMVNARALLGVLGWHA